MGTGSNEKMQFLATWGTRELKKPEKKTNFDKLCEFFGEYSALYSHNWILFVHELFKLVAETIAPPRGRFYEYKRDFDHF